MRPTVSQYAEALESVSREGAIGTVDIAKNFFGFLKRRGESGKAASIVKELEKRGAEQSGKLAVMAVTAHQPTRETAALLSAKAAALFPGKSIELEHEIDRTVIGGVRFQTDEALYDATVAAELGALKRVIK